MSQYLVTYGLTGGLTGGVHLLAKKNCHQLRMVSFFDLGLECIREVKEGKREDSRLLGNFVRFGDIQYLLLVQ